MGRESAWFFPTLRAAGGCERNVKKPERKPAAEYLSKPVRTAAQKKLHGLFAPRGKGLPHRRGGRRLRLPGTVS